VLRLRPAVFEALERHGIEIAPGDAPALLRDRLNDLYLADIRRLKSRQTCGEIPLGEYASHVSALKEAYSLLGLPLTLWLEPAPPAPPRR
jgi:hypothetical protein